MFLTTHPNSNKLVVKNDPWKQIDQCTVGSKQGKYFCAAQKIQWMDVEVVGQIVQYTEQTWISNEFAWNLNILLWDVFASSRESTECKTNIKIWYIVKKSTIIHTIQEISFQPRPVTIWIYSI